MLKFISKCLCKLAFLHHHQTTHTMNLITPEMIILFRPCPVLTLKEPQQPFRQSIKIQAVLFITLSGLSLLPKIHSKLVCFVPEPESFNRFCLGKNLINTSISLPVYYLINKGMKTTRSPILVKCLNAQENVKKGVCCHGD